MPHYGIFSYKSYHSKLTECFEKNIELYDANQHNLSNVDRSINEHLLIMEGETLASSRKEVWIDYDDFYEDLSEESTEEQVNELAEDSSEEQVNEITEEQVNGLTEEQVNEQHVCARCEKTYTSSYGLKYHIEHGHTKEKEDAYKPYCCPVDECRKTYRSTNRLKYHMAKRH